MAQNGPLIKLEGVTRRYQQGDMTLDALANVSLSIDSGDFVALRGPSGSGKSTLLHVLGLLERPSTGRYMLKGQDVAQMDDDARSEIRNRLMGFVFQSFYLIPYATALENALLPGLYGPTPKKVLVERAQKLFERMGLSDRMDFKPGKLSGGQQQRVALARALINEPSVILADEPTGQLDSKTSTEIMELCRQINAQGKTLIIVTHDAETASYAKRAINLVDGKIAGP
ncbi:MAG: ABC transporter ATP-binding protein [Thermodesulfobacteriota bacterium]|nr:ABC transporter ATP-binding protein [Thermodesulfobacteriota bacterium]